MLEIYKLDTLHIAGKKLGYFNQDIREKSQIYFLLQQVNLYYFFSLLHFSAVYQIDYLSVLFAD